MFFRLPSAYCFLPVTLSKTFLFSFTKRLNFKQRVNPQTGKPANANAMAKLFKTLLWVQGLYTLVTALWGLLHIESFMLVTGPKWDVWLVKTVSVLLVAIAAALLAFIKENRLSLPAILLGGLTALGMAAIDIYYHFADVIRWVYLLDAAAELLFATGWLILLFHLKKRQQV